MKQWRDLLGRTRRQRVIRVAEILIFLAVAGVVGIWFTFGQSLLEDDRLQFFATYSWPICFLLIFVWLVLVVFDMREGLRDISDRQG